MPTIKDVAKYAGVSHGTVSNVLKGVRTVSLENVRKVEDAIRALGYKPDASARNLKSDVSSNIGIILPNITDNFFAQLYTSLQQFLRNEGYDALLYITNEVVEEEKRILELLQSMKPAGIVIASCQPNDTEFFEGFLSAEVPTVFLERDVEGIDCNFVGFRNDKSIHYAVKTLLSEDFTHIGLIAGSDLYSSERLCAKGYRRALSDAGLDSDDRYIRFTSGRNEDAFKAAIQLFSLPIPPDAIICSSTQLVSGVLGAIKYIAPERVPRIITLSEDTWNDNRFSEVIRLPRSSLQLSDTIAQLLLDNIRNSVFFEHRRILLNNIYVDIEPQAQAQLLATPKICKLKVVFIEGDMADAIRSLLPELKCKQGIEVELEVHPHEQLYDILYDRAKKTDVDVFSVDLLWLREMAGRGILANMTSKIDDTFLSALNIQPELFDDFSRYNGYVYGIPYQYCNQLLFYRKDVFENLKNRRMFYEQYKAELKCPTSWSEFNAVARFFTRSCNPESPTRYGTTLGSRFSSAALCEYLPRMWAYGAEVFDHHGRVTLDSPNAVKALNNYCESFRYASPDSADNWWHEQVEEFACGDTAMMIMYSSYVSRIVDRSLSNIVGKVGYSAIPGGCSTLGGWSLCINQNSQNFDAALEFIKWACGKDLAIPLMLLGSLSACKTIYTSNEIRAIYPWVQKSLEIFPSSKRRGLPKNEKQISVKEYEEIIARAVHSCVISEDTPEEALHKAAQQLTKRMESAIS
jgi:multiple sugar transport system substrate-binding protein|nr:extracellular solute-binding protein [uncultured Oscillibacter sp.]